MATISKENYLKAIYSLSQRNGEIISTSTIAKELDLTNAAITEMANRLKAEGLIEYTKYKGIKILKKGERIAINVLRKHRLWELFLIKTLDLNWGDVHFEAERLEHCTSENLVNKIDEFLEFPEIDPHGAPIPDQDGTFRTKIRAIPLSECQIGKNYTVSRVSDKNPQLMNYLSQIDICLHKKIKIKEKLEFDGSVIIEVGNVSHSLSEKLIKNIFVSEV